MLLFFRDYLPTKTIFRLSFMFSALAMLITSCGGGGGGDGDDGNSTDSDNSEIALSTNPAILMENSYSIIPVCAIDSEGNAIVVWSRDEHDIYTSRFHKSSGIWSEPKLLQSSDNFLYDPQIAMDSDGNAIAVWVEDDHVIWAAQYSVADGWEMAAPIELDGDGSSSGSVIGMDGNGNAIAAWIRFDGFESASAGDSSVWSNRYVKGIGWGTAQKIKSSDGTGDLNVQLSITPEGDAFAVWSRVDSPAQVLVNQYDVESDSWMEPIALGRGNPSQFSGPKITHDSLGDTVVIWQDYSILHEELTLFESRLVKNNRDWVTTEIKSIPREDSDGVYYRFDNVNIKSDTMGNTAVAFTFKNNIYSLYRNVSKEWSEETFETNPELIRKVELLSFGNSFLLFWAQGNIDVWLNRLIYIEGWTSTEQIFNDVSPPSLFAVDINEYGNLMYAWLSNGKLYASVE